MEPEQEKAALPDCNVVIPHAAPATAVEVEVPKELVVIARNPQEMMVAQARLIAWSTRKVADAQEELADLTENLDTAKKHKWKISTLQRQQNRALRRVEFYEKIKAVLEAGYVIVPNMDIDIFAIRTERDRPMPHRVTTESNWTQPSDQQSEMPPAGEGQYVNPEAIVKERAYAVPSRTPGGDPIQRFDRWADEFRDVDFPFSTAKPQILSAAAEAMALKLFDDVGVSPSKRRASQVGSSPSVKGDPMVIGRVLIKQNTYATKAVSFLIAWYVDSREI